jgi:glycosyltransferase involved in cell wall biosynthesis
MTDSTRPIRIVRIIARLNIGGPAIHVTLLTAHLGAPAYESTLVCGSIESEEGDMSYLARQHGIEPVIIPQMGRSINPVKDALAIWKLYRLIRRYKPDVVHTHTAKAGFVGRVAARLAGVPVIVHTFHGHVFKGYFSPLKTFVFIWLERFTAPMSDTIITLTEGLRRELADTYRITRKGHITVLPLGLNLDEFANMPRKTGTFRKQYGIPETVPLIGIVGRLVPVKNHGLFLQAAARIKQQVPNARFVIVGDGETRPQVEAQIDELGLRDSVIVTGWIAEMAPVYADLDVKVICSHNEGTPVTVIEALAAGCPVVATNVGGLPDLLDQGRLGKLVPPGDVDMLANRVIGVLQYPPPAEIAQQAMLDRYSIDRLVSDLDSLYRGLLAKKKRRSLESAAR